MKIRIGNDVKLVVDVRQYSSIRDLLRESDVYNPESNDFNSIDDNEYVNKDYEVYNGDSSNFQSGNLPYVNRKTDIYYEGEVENKVKHLPIGIQSVKAIIINTSKQNERYEAIKKKTRFLGRFPVEPFTDDFMPTGYNIYCSGNPTWRAYPRKAIMHPYHGFGVHPEWSGIYTKLPLMNDTEYIAEVSATTDPNIIEVTFPAEHQLYTGTYKLVLVFKIYAPGYKHNIKTITVDMENVFELVKTTAEAIDNDVVVNVYKYVDGVATDVVEQNGNSYTGDIYVSTGEITDDNWIQLNRTDGETINIDANGLFGWYEGD